MILNMYLLSVRYYLLNSWVGYLPIRVYASLNAEESSELNRFESRFEAKDINEIAHRHQK